MRAQQPSTTKKNVNPRDIYKVIKWLGNPYRHTVLKYSMKMYLKVIGVVHVILSFLKVLLLLKLLCSWWLLRVLVLMLLR